MRENLYWHRTWTVFLRGWMELRQEGAAGRSRGFECGGDEHFGGEW